ncbi:hypothetical protein OPT61_g6042 [Boeremia exigua]|uniref:Uncharacterized protein n=1 Tax=Boeremia exigua TaxID=749465 RepID=A0ACC2I817_9PLEO|nr:hypothetical protein OPT61_g6042 [Boeremia exigua]
MTQPSNQLPDSEYPENHSAMSDSPLILASFEENIPHLSSRSTEVVYKTVAGSSKTTEACTPYVLLCHDPKMDSSLINLADSTLFQLRGNAFGNRRLSLAFPEMAMDTEADLCGATESQILSPILEILHERWNGRYCFRKETSPVSKGSVDSSARFDIVFEMNGNDRELIVVLELKRRELIRYEDFAQSKDPKMIHGMMDYNSQDNDNEERIHDAKSMRGRSPWAGNALPFLKQVSKYANGGGGCQHIALFNWDHLLLFKFRKEDIGTTKGSLQATAGDSAELTWVSENNAVHNRDEGKYIRREKIRKALLGFMVEAFQAKFGD